MALPSIIGVVGAGTMGAGIAQLAAQAGAQTLLCDAMPEQLQGGIATIQGALQRQVDKGRIAADDASAIRAVIAGQMLRNASKPVGAST